MLNINWIDDNHAIVFDADRFVTFDVTVRPKDRQRTARGRVKSRLYVNGSGVKKIEEELSHRKATEKIKEVFSPALRELLKSDELKMRFSRTAGCSCGCSPGFILENVDTPFDIWMDVE